MTDFPDQNVSCEKRRTRERALKPHITIDSEEDVAAQLEARPANTAKRREARNLVLAQLLMLAWTRPDAWLRYSRDRNAFAKLRRYNAGRLSYAGLMWSVDTLREAGLLVERRSAPGPLCAWQSRMRATATLLAASPITSIEQLQFRHPELIRLKNQDGELVNYDDKPSLRDRRHDITEQNEFMRRVKIGLNGGGWELDGRCIFRRGEQQFIPQSDQLYSVFNVDWRHGGRLYGPDWQSLSELDRTHLTLDDETTAEPDFKYMHPTLISALAGTGWGEGDPYLLPKFDRKLSKNAFNTLLNASSIRTAELAISDALQKRGLKQPRLTAKSLIEAVTARHPQFSEYWGSGVGLRLQRIDSDICLNVLRSLRRSGEVALPVHDSFIVRRSAVNLAEAAMAEALEQAIRKLRRGELTC